ncbi:MAG: DNA polymerase III subunit alpha [Bacteroidales bacterium]
MSFVHLHVHSEYSVLDGASKLTNLLHKAQDDGQPALALTDHGNMFGVKYFLDAIDHDDSLTIKPIIGCEVYVAKEHRTIRRGREDQSSYHLILLAKNKHGYHNLIKMVSLAYIEGMHYKPRIDHELLEKYHEDIICSSACLGGEVPQAIMKGDILKAEETVQWYKNLFGNDYYLEVQRHQTSIPRAETSTFEKQQIVNKEIFRIAEKYSVKVIATNDVHFVNKEDGPVHDRLICVSTNSLYDEPNRLRYTQQEYLKSEAEMAEIFSDHPETLANTIEVADKVERYTLNSKPILPIFPIPKEFADSNLYLRHLTYEGVKERYGENLSEEITKRIDYELSVIKNMGFPDYFLIVRDYIIAARNLGVVVGPGRGSAAGSVVAYCLTITSIDPIKYNLLFERFLNPERISMPDIDVDFDDSGRVKVFKYVEDKYGKNHVAHVVTFGKMATKSVIKDVARIENLPLQDSIQLTKMVPNSVTIKVEKEFPDPNDSGKMIKKMVDKDVAPSVKLCLDKIDDFKQAYENGGPIMHDTIEYASKLEGTVRNIGVHACALIIGREDLYNLVPLSTAKDKNTGQEIFVSQFDGSQIESVGLLKMDFLGLRNLSIIKECVNNIKLSKKIDVDIDKIPLDDKLTFDLFSRGDTIGVFQFESAGMQKSLINLKPTRFEDIIAMNALYRPGPMDYIPDFIARKHGEQEIKYDLPEMEEILKDTYGITVYQEQVMLLSQKIAGFTGGQADTLRKAMGKKKLKIMAQLKIKFLEGAMALGHPKDVLEKIWKDWTAFAQYAFNKSHATCYAWVGYQTAYLKAHYPAEFMAANMSKNISNLETLTKFMDDCRLKGIKVFGPDVNESYYDFTVNKEGNILYGMGGLKGMGSNVVTVIVKAREEGGRFNDIYDFVERVDMTCVNKKAIEILAGAGAFDNFDNINRGTFVLPVGNGDSFQDTLVKYGMLYQKDQESSVNSLFGDIAPIELSKPDIPLTPPLNDMAILKKEKELVGMYISAHPLDRYRFEINEFTTINLTDLSNKSTQAMEDKSLLNKEYYVAGLVNSVDNRLSKKNNRPWTLVNLEDYRGSMSFSLFGKDVEKYIPFLKVNSALFLKVKIEPKYERITKEEREAQGKDYWKNRKIIGGDIRIQNMCLLANLRESFIKAISLTIPLEFITKDFNKELVKILKSNKGKNELDLKILDKKKKISVEFFSRKYKVDITNDLINFLKEKDIKYKILKDVCI